MELLSAARVEHARRGHVNSTRTKRATRPQMSIRSRTARSPLEAIRARTVICSTHGARLSVRQFWTVQMEVEIAATSRIHPVQTLRVPRPRIIKAIHFRRAPIVGQIARQHFVKMASLSAATLSIRIARILAGLLSVEPPPITELTVHQLQHRRRQFRSATSSGV